jgi:hypothetical protein
MIVNLPKPEQIFARLIVMLNDPYGRNNQGINILKTLYCLSPLIHPDIIAVFKKTLPQLKQYLDGKFAKNSL